MRQDCTTKKQSIYQSASQDRKLPKTYQQYKSLLNGVSFCILVSKATKAYLITQVSFSHEAFVFCYTIPSRTPTHEVRTKTLKRRQNVNNVVTDVVFPLKQTRNKGILTKSALLSYLRGCLTMFKYFHGSKHLGKVHGRCIIIKFIIN